MSCHTVDGSACSRSHKNNGTNSKVPATKNFSVSD